MGVRGAGPERGSCISKALWRGLGSMGLPGWAPAGPAVMGLEAGSGCDLMLSSETTAVPTCVEVHPALGLTNSFSLACPGPSTEGSERLHPDRRVSRSGE